MYKKDAAPIAWPLFGYFFFFIAVVGIVMPYLSVYYKSIGFSGSQIGRLMATFTLASIFMPHFWGWLTTKTGKPKQTVQLAACGCFLGFIPFLWVTDFYWLWGLTIFVAIFYAAMTPMGDALAVRSIKHLDVPYSRIRVGGSIGYIVSVTLVGSLIGWFSESVIIPSVVICLGLTVLTTLKLKEQSFEPPARDGSGRFMTLLSEPKVLMFIGIAFLSYLAHAPFNTFFALHLSNAGYESSSIGLLIAFGVILEIVLFIYGGNVVKTIPLTHLFALCFIVGTVRWVLIGWYAQSLWVVILTQLLHCVTFALFHIAAIEQVRRLFPEVYLSQGQACYGGLAVGLGGGLGAVLAGYAWDAYGDAWTFTGASIASTLGLMVLLLSWKKMSEVAQ